MIVCLKTFKGDNKLGEIIMDIREDIKEKINRGEDDVDYIII